MSILVIILDSCMRKLAEFKNIIDYTSSYQATYDKVTSLIKPRLRIQMKTIEHYL